MVELCENMCLIMSIYIYIIMYQELKMVYLLPGIHAD